MIHDENCTGDCDDDGRLSRGEVLGYCFLGLVLLYFIARVLVNIYTI